MQVHSVIGLGGQTPDVAATASVNIEITNAETTEQLLGDGAMIGGSGKLGSGFVTGGKIYGQGYQGIEGGFGISTPSPIPVSAHVIPTHTFKNDILTFIADQLIEKNIKTAVDIYNWATEEGCD